MEVEEVEVEKLEEVEDMDMVREWSSEKSKSTKWPTVGSGHSECGPGMEFWEVEEHEVAYSWLRAFKMWPGN